MNGPVIRLRHAATCMRCKRRMLAGESARYVGSHGELAHVVECGVLSNKNHRAFERATRRAS